MTPFRHHGNNDHMMSKGYPIVPKTEEMICTQGTQTRLSTADENDHLVSFTSTCSLLSSTFNQFLLEVSKILRVPTDKHHQTLTVDKLISDFKEKSLLLNSIDTSELSFHSPLVPCSPPSMETSTPKSSPISLPVQEPTESGNTSP
eukprot:sb/3479748/